MKAISIQQPWAWAIIHGPKRIENRTWKTTHRGPIALHASLGWDRDGENSRLVRAAWSRFAADPPPMNVIGPLNRNSLHIGFGAIVGIADLVGVCEVRGDHATCLCGSWAAPGQYHWQLANVVALPHSIPASGRLKLWRVPTEVEHAVRAELAERAS